MTSRVLIPPVARPQMRPASSLGARLRQLRVSAGLTQSELAGDRCSKEYLSQIERGKTRPTADMLCWLAERLGVDAAFLESGQSSAEQAELEASVARAEAAVEGQQFEDAREALMELRFSPDAPDLELRALLADAETKRYFGEVRESLDVLARARELAELDTFTDVERAEVMYQMGLARYMLSSINSAIALFTEAYELATRSGLPCDRLRSHILEFRSRCSRRQRDLEAAREDIELALELAEGLGDTLSVAHMMFQASMIAERGGHAQIVLGRSLMEQGSLDEADEIFDAAEASLTQLSSASHSAVAWTAQGDLASRRGDAQTAAALYRRAAEALQDVRF